MRIPILLYLDSLGKKGYTKGIIITGVTYPLTDAEISCEYQYGVINEVLPEINCPIN